LQVIYKLQQVISKLQQVQHNLLQVKHKLLRNVLNLQHKLRAETNKQANKRAWSRQKRDMVPRHAVRSRECAVRNLKTWPCVEQNSV